MVDHAKKNAVGFCIANYMITHTPFYMIMVVVLVDRVLFAKLWDCCVRLEFARQNNCGVEVEVLHIIIKFVICIDLSFFYSLLGIYEQYVYI